MTNNIPSFSCETHSSLLSPSLEIETLKENSPSLERPNPFEQDSIDSPSLCESSSLWNKIVSWWKGSKELSSCSLSTLSSQIKPMEQVPVLEKPASLPDDLIHAKFSSSLSSSAKKKLTQSDLEEAIQAMSRHTLDSILFIIYEAQLELNKENVIVLESTFSKYAAFQKLQQKALPDIKETLAKDEKLLSRLQSAQGLSQFATFVTTLASAAIYFQVLPPVAAFIGTAAGAKAIGDAFLTAATIAGATGPIFSASFMALVEGTRAITKHSLNQNQARHENFNHCHQYNQRQRDHLHHLLDLGLKADEKTKEAWIHRLKELAKMNRIMIKK